MTEMRFIEILAEYRQKACDMLLVLIVKLVEKLDLRRYSFRWLTLMDDK